MKKKSLLHNFTRGEDNYKKISILVIWLGVDSRYFFNIHYIYGFVIFYNVTFSPSEKIWVVQKWVFVNKGWAYI